LLPKPQNPLIHPAKFILIILNIKRDGMTDKQKTASGREVKRTGMNDTKMSALQKLKAAREGNIKRTDQYEVLYFLL